MPGLQDVTHVLVQRAVQMEVDLDHTAAMLCDAMTQGAADSAAMLELQGLYALEQKRFRMAVAALSGVNVHLCMRDQDLRQSNEQLFAALVRLRTTSEPNVGYLSGDGFVLSIGFSCLHPLVGTLFADCNVGAA